MLQVRMMVFRRRDSSKSRFEKASFWPAPMPLLHDCRRKLGHKVAQMNRLAAKASEMPRSCFALRKRAPKPAPSKLFFSFSPREGVRCGKFACFRASVSRLVFPWAGSFADLGRKYTKSKEIPAKSKGKMRSCMSTLGSVCNVGKCDALVHCLY